MFGNYSKMIGAMVGPFLGLLVNKFALPADWAGPEMQGAVLILLSGLTTFLFPANKAS